MSRIFRKKMSRTGLGFREIQIIPPADELLSDEESYCVPVNRVEEPYPDTCTYLETQFSLLREDIVATYRQAVQQLRNIHERKYFHKQLYEVQVYSSVKYMGMRAGRDGVDYGVSFIVEGHHGDRIDWKQSKLLMFNSLLCVSKDGFITFFWAVVSNRDLITLNERNIIGLGPVEGNELTMETGVEYCMFESTQAYHEAYIHVLRVLQRPEMEKIYFHEHLVCLEPNVAFPEYANSGITIDWHQIWNFDSLDESQEEAINQGLTKKLAIIQGPPGTGKTFTGLLIVKALLAGFDRAKPSGPILVVCYTNRALDQFLEGIYEYEKKLLRLGSRTKSKLLRNCTLEELSKKRKKSGIPRNLGRQLQRAIKQKQSQAKTINYKCLNGFVSKDELSILCTKYANVCSRVSEASRNIQIHLLSKFKVLGMTTTIAARNYELLNSLKSEIMVVEEAAEVLESQILGCLNPSIKHLILIGDHMQLRPSVASTKLVETHKIDVSMFERMVRSGIEYKTLQVQRRMRPAISALVSRFYPMLRDHPSVHGFKDVQGVKNNVFFMDHQSTEDRAHGSGSRFNATEADLVVQFCLYLTNHCNYSPRDVTILSMYRSQTEEIMAKINNSYPLPKNQYSKSWINGVNSENYIPRVRSVDEFQGEESNIVLLSLVRNTNISNTFGSSQSIGFLNNANRICVALSRARIGLYIFGNANLLSDKSSIWSDIIQHLTHNGFVGNGITLCCPKHPNIEVVAYRPQDFMKYKEGQSFCTKRCKEMLHCGHCCPRICHSGGHQNFKCRERCMKKIPWCGHLCKKICHAVDYYNEECFPCEECRITHNVCDNLKHLLIQ